MKFVKKLCSEINSETRSNAFCCLNSSTEIFFNRDVFSVQTGKVCDSSFLSGSFCSKPQKNDQFQRLTNKILIQAMHIYCHESNPKKLCWPSDLKTK